MTVEIIGRSSSHFTRVVRIFAHELGVAAKLTPIHDLTALDAGSYAGNPALKLPSLRRNGSLLFGTQNICRAPSRAGASSGRRICATTCRATRKSSCGTVWRRKCRSSPARC
jgi:hypothetical protein